MPRFRGQLWLAADRTTEITVEILVENDRLRITSGGDVIGDWDASQIEVNDQPDGVHVLAEGEDLVIASADPGFKDAVLEDEPVSLGLASRIEAAAEREPSSAAETPLPDPASSPTPAPSHPPPPDESSWWRFWSLASWKEWWARRPAWNLYRSEARSLDSSIAAAESRLSTSNAELSKANQRLTWASEIGPQNLPIKTAQSETGLATVSGVALLETRRREGKDVWVPVDHGTVYVTDRQAIFDGSKSVKFRYDKLETQQLTPDGLYLSVSSRKRAHILSGPGEKLAALVTGAIAVARGASPTSPFESQVRDLMATVNEIQGDLAEKRAARAGLVVPPRPISPAWIPAAGLFLLFMAGGALAEPADPDPIAAATTTTESGTTSTQQETTTADQATTTTGAPTTTLPPVSQSEVIFGPPIASIAGDPNAPLPSDAEAVTVVTITDGDTLDVTLVDGTTDTVRLIGINSPETGECWSAESTLALTALTPPGSSVGLTIDVSERDRFDRLLRYLWVGGLHVNEELVRRGAAISRRYPPDTAMAQRLESAQIEAQSNSIGLWAPDACGPPTDADLRIVDLVADPEGDDNQNLNAELIKIRNMGHNLVDMTGWGIKDESASNRYTFPIGFSLAPGEVVTVYSGCGDDFGTDLYWCSVGSAIWNNDGDTVFLTDPAGNNHATRQYTPTTTTQAPATTTSTGEGGGGGSCDPSYPDVCIPPYPPDLNCGDISYRNFRVVGSDPHGFDGDNDGIGCES